MIWWLVAAGLWIATGIWMIYSHWAYCRDLDEAEAWRLKEYARIEKECKVGCRAFSPRGGNFCGNCGYHHDEHPQGEESRW